ncbi:MAG: SpoIID/LytB domain-containing protein [Bradymonadia bacterium]
MTRRDRTQALYSNKFVFDRNGEPLVSVRVSEAQSQITLKAKRGVRVMLNGHSEERLEVKNQSKWLITVAQASPAKVRHWVNIGTVGAAQFQEIKSLQAKALELKLAIRRFEAGSVMGLSGHTLDTRQLVVAVGPYDSEKLATLAATNLKAHFGQNTAVFEELLEPASGTIKAHEQRTGITVTGKDVLWFEGQNNTPIFFDKLKWGQGTPRSGVEARSYNGLIYVAIDQSGQLAVVNVLSAERLLEGVVPSELYTSAPLEALKAQAVAARGQLLAKIGTRHLADPYLLCAETHCQVYTGRARLHKRTSKAVKETRGQLLFDQQGLVDTTYSSTCGGHSESSHLVWGGQIKTAHPGFRDTLNSEATLMATDDIQTFVTTSPNSFCKKSGEAAKTYRWTKTVRSDKIAAKVRTYRDIGALMNLEVVRRGRSGRALSVRYEGQHGNVLIEGEYTNRKILGHLKSGLWIASPNLTGKSKLPRSWTFHGAGFGHGVGMCQHGAIGMAREGHAFDRILKHYYRGSALQKAW